MYCREYNFKLIGKEKIFGECPINYIPSPYETEQINKAIHVYSKNARTLRL